jgi:hypothetical protein
MRIHLALLVLAATLAPALPAAAQDIASPLVAELAAGIVCAPKVTGTLPAPDTVAGVTNLIDSLPPFVSDSRIVPAAIGLGFAVTSRAAKADLLDVRVELTHPPMGPEGATRQSYATDILASGESFTLYQLEAEYELVEGPWTMAAYAGDTLLWQVDFTLMPPELVPDLAAPCGFADLLS